MKVKNVFTALLCSATALCWSMTTSSYAALDRAGMAAIRGGNSVACAIPYPTQVNGCNACLSAGQVWDPMMMMYFTAYKSCSLNQGDDKCMTSSMFTSSRCARLPANCNSFLRYYRDAGCAMLFDTYINDCALTYDQATLHTQTGVNCELITGGVQ
jgi:hypothetical protein